MIKETITSLGEKKIIDKLIKPLFNPNNELFGIGDDCAMLECSNNELVLLSTDRIPADLISFKYGLIDYFDLGRYLAHLNFSDIAACGGNPIGLLLNFGLPNNLLLKDLKSILNGVKSVVDKYDCKILGGDITLASEISISATSIGKVKKKRVLTRRNAKVGDYIFTSRPLGLTPAAFEYFCNLKPNGFKISKANEAKLLKQFTEMYPMFELGQQLSLSHCCTSCMDNTDGLGQSLLEIAQLSEISMLIEKDKIVVTDLVEIIGSKTKQDSILFAFGAGADFSLVGTLDGNKSEEDYVKKFRNITLIGRVIKKQKKKVLINNKKNIYELKFKGWNYFKK